MAMIAITTSSSIRVKPSFFFLLLALPLEMRTLASAWSFGLTTAREMRAKSCLTNLDDFMISDSMFFHWKPPVVRSAVRSGVDSLILMEPYCFGWSRRTFSDRTTSMTRESWTVIWTVPNFRDSTCLRTSASQSGKGSVFNPAGVCKALCVSVLMHLCSRQTNSNLQYVN